MTYISQFNTCSMVSSVLTTFIALSFAAIGGWTGQLLEENAQALDQISANFACFKVNSLFYVMENYPESTKPSSSTSFFHCFVMQIHENTNLFCQARNNILAILNEYVRFSIFSMAVLSLSTQCFIA